MLSKPSSRLLTIFDALMLRQGQQCFCEKEKFKQKTRREKILSNQGSVFFWRKKQHNDNLDIDLVVKLYVSYYGGTIYLVLSNLSDFCGFQKYIVRNNYSTYIWIFVRSISYWKCSNLCQISKLLSNFGYLFTFCYSAWAN